jgi:hypothetical protein
MPISLATNIANSNPASIPYLVKDTDQFSGFRVVADTTERDAIHAGARTQGMLVYVTADSKIYTFASAAVANGDWVESSLFTKPVYVNASAGVDSTFESQTIFISDGNYLITKVSAIYATKPTESGNFQFRVVRDSGTESIGSGDEVATFDEKLTNNTVQNESSPFTTTLALGDRLSTKFFVDFFPDNNSGSKGLSCTVSMLKIL